MSRYGGLIRWKFAIPLVGFIVAVVVYVMMFLDAHVRDAVTHYATRLNGAEVNVGRLRTSVFGGFVELEKVQLTDPEAPEFNRLEWAKMRFELSGSALLRGKVVIQDASLQDIQIRSKRERPGYVLPPPPPEPEGPGLKEKTMVLLQPVKQELMQNAMAFLKEKNLDNPLKDVNWEELPSTLAVKGLQSELQAKGASWKGMLGSLPDAQTFASMKADLQKLKPPTDPNQIQTAIGQLESIRAQAQVSVMQVEKLAQQLQQEAATIQSRIQNLDELAKQDLAMLGQKLKLPDLDFKGLAEELAGPEIKRYVRMIETYYAQIKPFLESKEQEAPSKPLRRAGRDYSFPLANGLPSFWLQSAQISSKETAEGPLGDMSGKITHVSTQPELIAQPTRMSLQGGFRQSQIQGLEAEVLLDHRNPDRSEDSLQLKIASYPISERVLTQSQDFTLGFHQAKGQLDMRFALIGSEVEIGITNRFTGIAYKVEANSEKVKSILDGALAPLQEVSIEAKARGPWTALAWTIQSNLADQLKQGLRAAVGKELAALQDKIKSEVQIRLEGEKKKLEERLKAELNPTQDQVNGIKGQAEGVMSLIDEQKGKISNIVDAQKAELQKKADEEKRQALEKAEAEKKKQEDKAKQQIKDKIKLPGLGR